MTEQEPSGRLKKYYRTTELGKAAFIEWLSSPVEPDFRPGSLLTRIYFFDHLPEITRKQQLQEFELYNQKLLQQLQAMEKSLSEKDKANYFMISTLYHGVYSLQNNIRWFRHIGEQKSLSAILEEDEQGDMHLTF